MHAAVAVQDARFRVVAEAKRATAMRDIESGLERKKRCPVSFQPSTYNLAVRPSTLIEFRRHSVFERQFLWVFGVDGHPIVWVGEILDNTGKNLGLAEYACRRIADNTRQPTQGAKATQNRAIEHTIEVLNDHAVGRIHP